MGEEDKKWEVLYTFMGKTENILESLDKTVSGLSVNVQSLEKKIDVVNNTMVTKNICETIRKNSKAEKRQERIDLASQKKWFEFIPTVVSCFTLIVMLFAFFTYIQNGRNINSSFVQDLNTLIKETKQSNLNYKSKERKENGNSKKVN